MIIGGSIRGGDARLQSLSAYDCWQLVSELAGPDAIARIVWSGPNGLAIVPMNYAVADGILWFQTASGSRLAEEARDQQVLVEVDQIDPASHTGWSVVVTGVASCMPAEQDPGLLANLQVWPRGSRDLLLKVEPHELTGRQLRDHG
jgi:uncharacterized protein